MTLPDALALRLRQPDGSDTSALLVSPAAARAVYVFAHGGGAGMRHVFMSEFATGLAARGIATLRYDFPFIERGSKRVDVPAVAHAAVRSACAAARDTFPTLPLFAGGKSFGGRMTSQAQAATPLAGVAGLVFVGFPLHPAGRPAIDRAAHLAEVDVPMLFLQGTRDELADATSIADVVATLPRARLAWFADADHAFHVRRASGSDEVTTRHAMLDATVAWMDRTVATR